MEKYLIVKKRKLAVNEDGLNSRPTAVDNQAVSASGGEGVASSSQSLVPGDSEDALKKSTENTGEGNPKRKPLRLWNENWTTDRPWLKLENDKMFCLWCKKYMDSNENAHKTTFIKGEKKTMNVQLFYT